MNSQKLQSQNRRVYFLFGVPNSGKSHLIKTVLLSEFTNQAVIIIDCNAEYNISGFILVNNIRDVLTLLQSVKNPKIIYRIDVENQSDFSLVCRISSCIKNDDLQDGICLVIDEIANYKDGINDWLDGMLRRGRHYNQSVIISTQCPVDLPPYYRQNITNIFFFQILEKRYIDFARSIIGDLSDKLIDLPQGQYLKFPDCVISDK
jgi:hypothetical protein